MVTKLSKQYEIALRECRESILRRDEIPKMPHLFAATESTRRKIQLASENLDLALDQKKVIEYKALYAIGQGLTEAMAITDQRNYTLCKAADDHSVTRNRARIAFRIYNIFHDWPAALDFMTNLPLKTWFIMTDYEINQLQMVLSTEFNERPIPLEWESTFGRTVIGYHEQVDDNGNIHWAPTYDDGPRAQAINIRDYTGYDHSSEESPGESSVNMTSTDSGWYEA
jgi:hypothetical protein